MTFPADPRPARRAVLTALATAPLATGATLRAQAPSTASPAGEEWVTPERFGAVGDGQADDAPAIRRAIAAAATRGDGGTVVLRPAIAYRCGSGFEIDASRVSLWGQGLLDFSGVTGACVTVTASSRAQPFTPAQNYGAKGMVSGALRLRGPGAKSHTIGLAFASPVAGTAAQLLVENLTIESCGTGVRFGDRAYNSLFLRSEVFGCGTCVDYPAADDNGERNTFVGCTFYNSDLAVRMAQPSASLQLQGCSLDYVRRLYAVAGGVVQASTCHHESDRWDDAPVRVAGDGAIVRMEGGWLLNRAADWPAHRIADIGRGATAEMIGVTVHNLALRPPDASRPTSWAGGEGLFRMRDTNGFDQGVLPPRLHATRTRLSDPEFRADDWQDPVWRNADTSPALLDAHAGGTAPVNLVLSKTVRDGESALLAAKAFGTTSAAAFVLLALPVRPGEQVLAGFRVRRDPARPGRDGTLHASPGWARIDGADAHGVPRVVRAEQVGTLTVQPPTDRYAAVAPLNTRASRTAPSWATHFCMTVNLVQAHEASFLFNGLWADTI